MRSYVKAIRLHYRKKATPSGLNVHAIHDMARAGAWNELHDYLVDSAYNQYRNPQHAEDYARQHTDYLRHHYAGQYVDPEEAVWNTVSNMGKLTKPAHMLQEGDQISSPKRGQRVEIRRIEQPSPPLRPRFRENLRTRFMGPRNPKIRAEYWNPELAQADFSELWHHQPIVYHPPESANDQ